MNSEPPLIRGETYVPTDRRPIAARSWRIWQRTSVWIAQRNITANSISIAGMAFGIFAGISLSLSAFLPAYYRCLFLVAAGCIQLRLLANLLDGMVAIESGKASKLGELYNEVPDRISDASILIGAGYAINGVVELGYLAALAAVLTAYIRAMGKATGAPQDYSGPMAKQQRMALLIIVLIYLAITPVSWQLLINYQEYQLNLLRLALILIIVGALITFARRLLHITYFLKSK